MSTNTSETTKKLTPAEVDIMLAAEPKLTGLSCQALCQERENDLELLQDLDEFPPKSRAQVRASLIRSLAAIAVQLKNQKCPPCGA